MAKVLTGALLSDIRGKVGGSAFVKTAGGLILRNTPTPVNKNTVLQSSRKNITANLQWEWQRLTQAQRNCWVEWTKLNPINQIRDKDLFINAQQTFIKLNFYRLLYGFAVIKDPVFDTNIIEPIGATILLSAGDLTLSLDRTLNDSTELFILFLTFRVTPTINNPGTIFKAIVFEQSPGTDAYNITTEYKAIFGVQLVASEQLFMKFTTADKISGKLLTFQQKKIIL